VATETRNVLLCGRTRSGKTTVMNVLKDPCHSPTNRSIFSETQNPRFQSFSINNRADAEVQKFTIHIIDSPGLFEVKDKDSMEQKRPNEVIASTIATCLENEITNIHCIVMFATFEAGINRDDIESMKVFLDMFGGSGVSVALCVTHADKHGVGWRQEIRDELMLHPDLAALVEEEKMAIHFMGCVNVDDRPYYDEEQMKEDYVSVYKMRQDMLEFIFGAKEKKMLNEMNVARKKILEVSGLMDTVTRNFEFFALCPDFSTCHAQEIIIKHKADIATLGSNSVYAGQAELADKFVLLVQAAERLKARVDMDQVLKTSLLWPLQLRQVSPD